MIGVNHGKFHAAISLVILFFVCLLAVPNASAQQPITFTPADNFSIPTNNANVHFVSSGTYSSATTENGAWTFINLKMNGSQTLDSLRVSAADSNVTIQYYRRANATFPIERIRYTAEGVGQQTLKLNSGVGQLSDVIWVSVPGNSFAAQEKIWKITSDGAFQVNGQVGNISITHYALAAVVQNPNATFYEAHSGALSVLVLVAVIIGISAAIKVRNNKQPEKEVL